MMNLEKMLEFQDKLDAHITKEKGLNPVGNVDWKTLALDVELSELANEWRGFKFWSEDREPRNKDIECHVCKGNGGFVFPDDEPFEPCLYCEGTGIQEKNPLLEEYADCVSFFLSIANEKGWQGRLYLHEEAILDLEEEGFQGGITGALLEIKYHLIKSYMEIKPDEDIEKALGYTKQEFHFRNAWFVFIAIGLIGFKFTEEQIEQAYYSKNKINYERQESGY